MRLSKTILMLPALAWGIGSLAQTKTGDRFLIQSEAKLSAAKAQYASGDAAVVKDVNSLIADADKAMTAGPFSVTFHKTKMAPSGDAHDYVSQAPYWWADPSKPDGKPYIRKDGERNPEIYLLHDDSQMGEMGQAVKKLGLTYYFTGNEKYAQRAAELMKVWFVDASTRMNPNFNYAQYIPGLNDGRGIGIIESRGLVDIPDAIAMMSNSKALTADLKSGVKKWFAEYLRWLQTSKNGKDEEHSQNNHGTFYDVQVVDFAMFTGDDQLAKSVIEKRTIARMDTQFTTDGRQPLELERTKSWGYSNMNLDGWCRLAVLADHLGIDLWHTQKDGRSIKKCIEFMMPFVLDQKKWVYKQIEPIGYGETISILAFADGKYPDMNFAQAYKLHGAPKPWM